MATGFSLTIPRSRDMYHNGNILLYLLDEGPRSEWWKIEVNPSSSTTLEGSVSKVSVRGEQQEQDKHLGAIQALEGCFLQAQNIQSIAAPIIGINWTPDMKRNVGFTLRGIGLADYANIDITVKVQERICKMITSNVIKEHQVTCVYGLVSLTPDGEIDVVAVAKVLKDLCGFHCLRFLFHAYNPQGWVDWFSWRGANFKDKTFSACSSSTAI